MKGFETKEEIQAMRERAREAYKKVLEIEVWMEEEQPKRRIPREKSMRKIPYPWMKTPTEIEFSERIELMKSTGCVLCESKNKLHFHHIHPEDKQFGIVGYHGYRTIDILLEELNKCVILCPPCHMKVHGSNPPPSYMKRPELFLLLQKATSSRTEEVKRLAEIRYKFMKLKRKKPKSK